MPKKPYSVVQTRTAKVLADNIEDAKLEGAKAFNAYVIADHPGVQEGEIVVRETIYENLPMNLNLADSMTRIGWAVVHRDLETGDISLEIRMHHLTTEIMDNLLEIADLKAVGFAGMMKKPRKDNVDASG